MSEQLNHTVSENLYVDFSTNSMKIAQLCIQLRKCISVVWITEWIENISRLGVGNFDLVLCTGVFTT